MPSIRSYLSGIASFAMMMTVAMPALAQTAAPPSAQELNPAQRAPAPAPAQQSRGDILSAPEPGPCPLRDSKLTFTLSSVAFTGADTLTPDDLSPSYAGMIGKTGA